MYGIIRLKYPVDLVERMDVLAHEAAHQRQLKLGDAFSSEWLGYCAIQRLEGESWTSPELAEREGLVNSYAAFNYNLDLPVSPKSPFRLPMASKLTREGVHIHVCSGSYDVTGDEFIIGESTLDVLSQRCKRLPSGLQEHLDIIILEPLLEAMGDFTVDGGEISPVNKACAEDIAVHTEAFYRAASYPVSNLFVLEKLAFFPQARMRLVLLEENGFLERDHSERIAKMMEKYAGELVNAVARRNDECYPLGPPLRDPTPKEVDYVGGLMHSIQGGTDFR
jgi:hypothetical protein